MRTTISLGSLALGTALAMTACSPQGQAPGGPGSTASGESRVVLAPTAGNRAKGELTLATSADGVRITGTIDGLEPGTEHGFHIHEHGDCGTADASSAGEHFNPGGDPHGNPAIGAHHAGDIHNLKSDARGVAQVDTTVDGVSLGGPNDIRGKAIIVHASADDYATQPSGNSGARIACGVIPSAGS